MSCALMMGVALQIVYVEPLAAHPEIIVRIQRNMSVRHARVTTSLAACTSTASLKQSVVLEDKPAVPESVVRPD